MMDECLRRNDDILVQIPKQPSCVSERAADGLYAIQETEVQLRVTYLKDMAQGTLWEEMEAPHGTMMSVS